MEDTATPVGTSFLGRFIDFETTPDGGGDPAGGGDFPAPAIPAADDNLLGDDGAEFDFGDGEPEPQGEPEPAAWAGPSQDEWSQVQQGMQSISQLMEFLQAEGEQQPQPAPEPAATVDWENLDATDPEAVRDAIREEASRMLDERFGPYQPILEQQAQQHGEEMVRSAFDTIAGEIGEFDRDQAVLLANSFLANGMQPEQAFRQAAAVRLADEQRISAAAVKAYQESLGNLEGVDPEPVSGGGALESEGFKYDPRDPDKYAKLAEHHLARRRSAQAQSLG